MKLLARIRTALLAEGSSVKTVVGSSRIYPVGLPQEPTLPAVTMEQISGSAGNALASLSALVWARVRIYAWGETYEAARTLAGQIEAELNGEEFASDGSVTICSVVADGPRDGYEDAVEAYHTDQDYRIWYKRA